MTNEKFNTIIRVLQKTLKPKNVEIRLSSTKSCRDKLIIEFYAKPYNLCIAELIFKHEPVIKENKFYLEMEFSYVHIDKQCTVEEKDLVNKIIKQFKSENYYENQ